jgi:hypothetical protein
MLSKFMIVSDLELYLERVNEIMTFTGHTELISIHLAFLQMYNTVAF